MDRNMAHEQNSESELWKVFWLFDKNRDGQITSDELKDVLTRLGHSLTTEQISEMIQGVDTDRNGTIDFNEFKTLMEYATFDEEMVEAFHIFDQDGNGFISSEELKNTILRSMGEELTNDELAEMIREADVNNDGQVDYKEFAKFVCMKSLRNFF
ncbi:hypothetical protein LUZ60_006687 [Juncus effusus]|nr:hypothetical protein LUZ60_006687 [Juncus effusus]